MNPRMQRQRKAFDKKIATVLVPVEVLVVVHGCIIDGPTFFFLEKQRDISVDCITYYNVVQLQFSIVIVHLFEFICILSVIYTYQLV